eukprot:12024296-Ditylum_brightwellii.AAC.1
MKNKIKQEDWAIKKSELAQINEKLTDKSGSTSTEPKQAKGKENHVGWAEAHCAFIQSEYLKECVLLNSNSNVTMFCNQEYITNILPYHGEPFPLGANGGRIESNIACDVPHLGIHWFIEDAITNIISLADITK